MRFIDSPFARMTTPVQCNSLTDFGRPKTMQINNGVKQRIARMKMQKKEENKRAVIRALVEQKSGVADLFVKLHANATIRCTNDRQQRRGEKKKKTTNE